MVHKITYGSKSFDIICCDGFMSNNLSSGLFYENEMLDYIRNMSISGTYLDIGAYIGTHSIFFSELCEQCNNVLAYEPVKANFNVLRLNTTKYPKIKIFNVAVGERNTCCHMKLVKENRGMSFVSETNIGKTRMITIDSQLLDYKNKIGLIKIDVEGYEFEVLKGAINTIDKHRPHLFVEIIGDTSKIESFLHPFNYKIIQCFNNTPTYLFSSSDEITSEYII